MDLKTIEQFKIDYFNDIEIKIRENKKVNATDKMLLDMFIGFDDLPKTKKSEFNRFIKSQYKAYKIDEERKAILNQVKIEQSSIVTKLRKTVKTSNPRKERARRLIEIGALFDATEFTKMYGNDKGLITGLILSAMEELKEKEFLKSTFKSQGDKFLDEKSSKNKTKEDS